MVSNPANTAVTGARIPVVGASNSLVSTREPGLKAITLAFATGTCGSENWGGVAADAFVNANIPKLDAAGVDYIVSTGGAAGSFKCSGAALQSFIARYATPHMIGVDFDIESGQSAADVQNLVSAAALAQAKYPGMRFSFTLATLAASDGSYGGLNSTGDATVRAIKASTLTNYTINLMTMDFGRATAANCVLSGSTCQMGKSSIQAVTNLQQLPLLFIGAGIEASIPWWLLVAQVAIPAALFAGALWIGRRMRLVAKAGVLLVALAVVAQLSLLAEQLASLLYFAAPVG